VVRAEAILRPGVGDGAHPGQALASQRTAVQRPDVTGGVQSIASSCTIGGSIYGWGIRCSASTVCKAGDDSNPRLFAGGQTVPGARAARELATSERATVTACRVADGAALSWSRLNNGQERRPTPEAELAKLWGFRGRRLWGIFVEPVAESNQGDSNVRLRLSLTAWGSGNEPTSQTSQTSPTPSEPEHRCIRCTSPARPSLFFALFICTSSPTGTESSANGVLQNHVLHGRKPVKSTPDFRSDWSCGQNVCQAHLPRLYKQRPSPLPLTSPGLPRTTWTTWTTWYRLGTD
jgi:hypothetical protein